MKLKEVRIRQFGPLRNEALEDIGNDRLIVISGHNRAGKSVLMEALRALPVGYEKGGRYKEFGKTAEVDAVFAEGSSLRLKGYAVPKAATPEGTETTAADLYGLDPNLYRGLYTIDLSDLMSAGRMDFVSQVLLGGGEKELESLPAIFKASEKKYRELGGERGTSGEMAAAQKTVKAAQEKRAQASAQVEAYAAAARDYRICTEELTAAEDAAAALSVRVGDLKTLQHFEGEYKALVEEEADLSADPAAASAYRLETADRQRLKILKEEYIKRSAALQSLLDREADAPYPVEAEETLRQAKKWLAGREERALKVARVEAKLEQAGARRRELIGTLHREMGENWDLPRLAALSLDRAQMETARELSRRVQNQGEEQERQREKDRNRGESARRLSLFFALGAAILATAVGILWSAVMAVPLCLLALFALLLYVKKAEAPAQTEAGPVEEAQKLAAMKQVLLLPADCPDGVLFSRQDVLLRCKEDHLDLLEEEKEAARERELLMSLRQEAEALFPFVALSENLSVGEYFRALNEVLLAVEEYGDLRKEKELLLQKLQDVEAEFSALGFDTQKTGAGLLAELELAVQQSERYEDYVLRGKKLTARKETLAAGLSLRFGTVEAAALYQPFLAGESLAEALRRAEEELQVQQKRADNLRQKRADLRLRMEKNASPEALDAAKRELDQAREAHRTLALRYARARLTTQMLKDFYEQKVEERQATLLKDGWDYFKTITAGAYDRFRPELSGKEVEFMAKSGDVELPALALSRGTAEELYLSVRLGRIKSLGRALPILLDDSLVNFDKAHRERAFAAIADAAGEGQVFFFTCHGQMVREAALAFGSARCFNLVGGRLIPSTLEETLTLLEGENHDR